MRNPTLTPCFPTASAASDELTADPVPLFSAPVPAGFPSPADDHLEGSLDIRALLVRRPAATFFCRAQGPSMREAGIQDGDLLVVDRSVEPHSGDVVVAALDGGLTVKRLLRAADGRWVLAPDNSDFAPIPIDPAEGARIWGVVTWSLTAHCRR